MTTIRDQQAQRVLELITRSMDERGYPPSRREIAACLGRTSVDTGQRVVEQMVRDGLIEVDKGVQRGIRVVAKAKVETL